MRPSHCRLCSNPPDCFATLAGRLSLKPDARIAMMAHATALTRREAGGHVRQSQWRGQVETDALSPDHCQCGGGDVIACG
jgi:hypothetical protein